MADMVVIGASIANLIEALLHFGTICVLDLISLHLLISGVSDDVLIIVEDDTC